MNRTIKLIILISTFFSFNVSASTYLCPNELNIANARTIFEKSNKGVYVSVGSERSFMGAALSRAQALFVIDIDQDVITFVKINKALLSVSKNKEHYYYLRTRASFHEWQKNGLTLTQKHWNFWNNYMKGRPSPKVKYKFCREYLTKPSRNDNFYGVNYLFNDALYRHLKNLAQNNRIYAVTTDLNDLDQVKNTVSLISKLNLNLAVLDTSNIPFEFVGVDNSVIYIEQFGKISAPDTIFFQSQLHKNVPFNSWSFYAYTKRYVDACGSEFKNQMIELYFQLYKNLTTKVFLDNIELEGILQYNK